MKLESAKIASIPQKTQVWQEEITKESHLGVSKRSPKPISMMVSRGDYRLVQTTPKKLRNQFGMRICPRISLEKTWISKKPICPFQKNKKMLQELLHCLASLKKTKDLLQRKAEGA